MAPSSWVSKVVMMVIISRPTSAVRIAQQPDAEIASSGRALKNAMMGMISMMISAGTAAEAHAVAMVYCRMAKHAMMGMHSIPMPV